MMMSSSFFAVVVLCLLVDVSTADGQLRPGVVVMDHREGPAAANGSRPDVSESSWGFDDRVAYVGRLFEYRLARDGANVVEKVSGLESSALPDWMHYDAVSGLLEGVPMSSDVGNTFLVEVTTTPATGGHDGEPAQNTVDTFEVRVADEGSLPPSEAEFPESGRNSDVPRPIRCLPGSAVTTATVVVDADVVRMSAADRSALLRAMCVHLDLPVAGVRVAVAADGRTAVDDGSALVAGPGNVPPTAAKNDDAASGRPRALIQWEVGCGNVFAAHMSVLQRVETTALDGTMAERVGHGVFGWHVANKKPSAAAAPTRHRRQAPRVVATATPTVSVTPPTARPVPTKTVTVPEPTAVVPIFPPAQPTTRPPRTKKPPRTPRPTQPRPTTTPRSTTLKTSTARPTSATVERLQPSVSTKPTTTPTKKTTDVPTQPLPVSKAAGTTIHPPLVWTGNFPGFSVSVNQIVDEVLPDDAFEGGAPGGRLTFQLLTKDELLSTISWLKLDETSGRFHGMPMSSQVGTTELIVQATDRSGSTARGSFTVEVVRRPQVAKPAFVSSAAFDLDYDTFCEDDALRMDVATKLAAGFGDPDASKLAITDVRPGSVVLSWTNSSMSADGGCPADAVAAIQSKMFNDDGTLRDSFKKAIEPYTILNAEMAKRGSCGTETIRATPGAAPVIDASESPGRPAAGSGQSASTVSVTLSGPKSAGGDHTVIIVVLIVIAVVVLVTIVVCVIVCRRRRRKQWSPDKKVKPGAPIILAYELDDMAASPAPTKPLIGAAGSEKPPAPPDYQLATGANGGASPPTDNRRPLLSSDPAADQMSPLKFQPPPGSVAARGQQQQPAGQRRPPAYVSAT